MTLAPSFEQESVVDTTNKPAPSPDMKFVLVNGKPMTIDAAISHVSTPVSLNYPPSIIERKKAENLEAITAAMRLGMRGHIGIDGHTVQLVYND
jgi:hypothetical protein